MEPSHIPHDSNSISFSTGTLIADTGSGLVKAQITGAHPTSAGKKSMKTVHEDWSSILTKHSIKSIKK